MEGIPVRLATLAPRNLPRPFPVSALVPYPEEPRPPGYLGGAEGVGDVRPISANRACHAASIDAVFAAPPYPA